MTSKQPALDNEAMTALTERFLKTFSVTNKTSILCSYSGGPDSTFLLHFLCSLRDKTGLKLTAFYLNHNLRGKESVEEEKFVFSTISRLSVPTVFYSKDIGAMAKERKVSTELCGRDVRRGIIHQLTKTFQPDYVCTGHHRDDRVETYLFNTFRGSGLHGLTTLKKQDGKLIRPLLSLSKNEIENYLRDEKIPFFQDSTNRENEYRRNRIRNLIIPTVKEHINPGLEQTIERNISVLEEYEATVSKLVSIFLKRYVQRIGNYVYILNGMKNDPIFTPLLLKEVFRAVIRSNNHPERGLSFINYQEVLDFFLREKAGTIRLPVPGGVQAFFDEKSMVVVFNNDFERLKNCSFRLLSPDSAIEEPYFSLSLKPCTGQSQRRFLLEFPVTVRGRKNGDRAYIGGLENDKKTKEILIDRKVPAYEKVFHPVIELSTDHCFLAGIGMEGFAFEHHGKQYAFHYKRNKQE